MNDTTNQGQDNKYSNKIKTTYTPNRSEKKKKKKCYQKEVI